MRGRVKRRYLALEIESNERFSSTEFMDAVWSAITKLYGEYGASKTGLTLIDCDVEGRFAVVRVSLTALPMIRATLASITRIGDKCVAVNVQTVSGTLKALHGNLKH